MPWRTRPCARSKPTSGAGHGRESKNSRGGDGSGRFVDVDDVVAYPQARDTPNGVSPAVCKTPLASPTRLWCGRQTPATDTPADRASTAASFVPLCRRLFSSVAWCHPERPADQRTHGHTGWREDHATKAHGGRTRGKSQAGGRTRDKTHRAAGSASNETSPCTPLPSARAPWGEQTPSASQRRRAVRQSRPAGAACRPRMRWRATRSSSAFSTSLS